VFQEQADAVVAEGTELMATFKRDLEHEKELAEKRYEEALKRDKERYQEQKKRDEARAKVLHQLSESLSLQSQMLWNSRGK
jgi:hypothetical protein